MHMIVRVLLVTSIFLVAAIASRELLAAEKAHDTVLPADAIRAGLEPARNRRGSTDQSVLHSLETISRLKSVRQKRGLNLQERDELAEAIKPFPRIDLTVYFDFNSSVIAKRAIPQLDELGSALKGLTASTQALFVIGHTDAKGSDAYNLSLSERRAEAVVSYLKTRFAIPAPLLVPEGFGERRLRNSSVPFAPENRRVEIVNISKALGEK